VVLELQRRDCLEFLPLTRHAFILVLLDHLIQRRNGLVVRVGGVTEAGGGRKGAGGEEG